MKTKKSKFEEICNDVSSYGWAIVAALALILAARVGVLISPLWVGIVFHSLCVITASTSIIGIFLKRKRKKNCCQGGDCKCEKQTTNKQ